MRNRLKEEEKIERTIRGLLKLPENRRCINCNSLGPQYVCTTFLTFVCTSCSGVHREFTHRVKSVSVAKFTAEEVSALQAGGNERARQIYFKEWDPERHSLPDGSNLHRLRDFIKHVYVDRKYTGERSKELPRLRLGNKDKDASIESGKFTIFEGRSRSPPQEGNQERYNSERCSPYGRNDDRNIRYYYDERKSPRYYKENSRVGGYRRNPVCFEVVDDRFKDDEFGNRRISSGGSTLRSRSPDRKKNIYGSHSPVVNHSKESLGEKMQALRIGEISKANDGKSVDNSAHNKQKNVSSNNEESAQKIVSVNNQESAHGNPVKHEKKKSESLIDFSTEFEPPDSATMSQSQSVSSYENISSQALIETSNKEKPSHGPNANTMGALLFDQPSASLVTDSDFSWQQTTTSIGAPKNEDTTTGVDSQIHSVETKSNNRMEIPADLFAASYSSIPAPVSGWQTGPPSSMGYNMHFQPNSTPVPAFSNSASSNPFEINDGRSQVLTAPFPSMAMVQGGPPNASSSNASMMSSQLTSSGSDFTHSAYLEPQMQNNMISSRPQGIGSFGSDGADFGSLNTAKQPITGFSAPGNTSSFASMRGNPFE